MDTVEIETPSGLARVHLDLVAASPCALAIGHGAGGGVAARDIAKAAAAARGQGCSVALVEQPYRVAGRRSPAPAARLDTAWVAVIEHLRAGPFAGLALVAGGRSMGARVACRTAGAVGAAGVLCLAFPLVPPRRSGGKEPVSRLPELDAVVVPTLVVQGERDPFGMPPEGPRRRVVAVAGDHALAGDLRAVGAAVGDWLGELVAPARVGTTVSPNDEGDR